ncbi:hypothetical protein FIV34_16505 [Luteibacter pinisoli]|uniref:ATP-grasp domain-containing protein n=1 Tax=Luteibacter pinisoli TaxID=2589080 RepID=A0A4Y5Z951_9GAMM|nr:hypothetical protein [Luteibacter pinisoli]QDE40693.1 hypothetical protein FIV34_16505 [Luteibacter pinisoli]
MTILVMSQRLDYHGRAVTWGLHQMGCKVHWWDRSIYPGQQQLSLSLTDDGGCHMVSDGGDWPVPSGGYVAIWERRGKVPTPSPGLSAVDRRVASNESRKFLCGLVSILEVQNPDALVTNPAWAQERANEKALQLHVAKQVGMDIPSTLISNEPRRIRDFYRMHGGKVITKQHFPFSWRQPNGDLFLSGTFIVPPEAMESDAMLEASPMIFQEALDISGELRIIVFGRTVFAGLQPRAAEGMPGFSDIRLEPRNELSVIDLDPGLRDKLFAFMERMGLNYAAFDIARTRDGRELFLEANEAGQFLSLESLDPTCHMLDAFCQYLASGDKAFEYKNPSGLRLTSFEDSSDGRLFREEFDHHMKFEYKAQPFELSEA